MCISAEVKEYYKTAFNDFFSQVYLLHFVVFILQTTKAEQNKTAQCDIGAYIHCG